MRSDFEIRWCLIVGTISSGATLIGLTVLAIANNLKAHYSNILPQLIETINPISHSVFVIILSALSITLIGSILKLPTDPSTHTTPWHRKIIQFLRHHPITSSILAAYIATMVNESSWFYKEIVTWYDDIYTDYLLDNFSLRSGLVREVVGLNNFRFFPLSHQDLHLLSWISPYPKIWSLISGAELIAIVLLGCKIIKISYPKKQAPGLALIATLLFLLTSSTAYNFFQFIYSERILTLLFTLYLYHYLKYQQSGSPRHSRFALLFTLLGLFFKDSAIILFLTPPLITLGAGSLGWAKYYPAHQAKSLLDWRRTFRLELALCSLMPFFLASALALSVVPSSLLTNDRYDADLGLSILEPDLRVIWLAVFVVIRVIQWCCRESKVTLIDCANFAALAYAFSLFVLVGFKASSYMALPLQFVAMLDALVAWSLWIAPALSARLSRRWTSTVGVGFCILLITVEDGFAETFRSRFAAIQQTHRSWRSTLHHAERLALKERRQGKPVNLIFSKSWFKHSDYLQRLNVDRLIYLDPISHQHRILEGIDKGLPYTPQTGDLFIDIDSGKKLQKYGIDLTQYQQIYVYNPDLNNGRIYRHK